MLSELGTGEQRGRRKESDIQTKHRMGDDLRSIDQERVFDKKLVSVLELRSQGGW